MAKVINFRGREQLRQHIVSGEPTLYCASQTSLVIPFEKLFLENLLPESSCIGNLAGIPSEMTFINDSVLEISGAVTWKDAKEFCVEHGRQVMTSPTEELACVLSGVATSATGERCFGFGTIRDQVQKVWFIDKDGQEICLDASKSIDENFLNIDASSLKAYQKSFDKYQNFKNAPYPRLEKQTDLMVGTEGQLGVITKIWLKTVPNDRVTYLFLKLNKWEDGTDAHLEFFHSVQNFRGKILSCEFMDENSLSYLKRIERPVIGKDLIFIEVLSDQFDEIYKELILKLKYINEEDFFEVSRSECQKIRVSIPRAIFEDNDKRGVIKKASDVQVVGESFDQMLRFYQKWTQKESLPYNLFGHFGDGHLHFNFMPNFDKVMQADKLLNDLYQEVVAWHGSPFAEHGIGIIKKQYIQKFYQPIHHEMFAHLKKKFDPQNKFFPEGYLS